jgi:hypothetical protein
MYTLASGCSSIILRAKVQLRIEASAWFEQEDPRTLDERDGATASNENIGVYEPMVTGGTGSTADDLADIGLGVPNWHTEPINGF